MAQPRLSPMTPVHSRRPRQRSAWPPLQLDVDEMSGEQFEDVLAHLFELQGYTVELTPKFGDYGADLVLTAGSERTLVQAKCWSRQVGVKAVQEAAAGRPYWRCERALVVTSNFFGKEAKALAASNAVELWDRERLIDQLAAAKLLAPTKLVNAPACRKCGAAMTRRQGKNGGDPFYGCTTFPRCWFTLPMAAGERIVLAPAPMPPAVAVAPEASIPAVALGRAPRRGLRGLLDRMVS
jgi:restriction system protein